MSGVSSGVCSCPGVSVAYGVSAPAVGVGVGVFRIGVIPDCDLDFSLLTFDWRLGSVMKVVSDPFLVGTFGGFFLVRLIVGDASPSWSVFSTFLRLRYDLRFVSSAGVGVDVGNGVTPKPQNPMRCYRG